LLWHILVPFFHFINIGITVCNTIILAHARRRISTVSDNGGGKPGNPYQAICRPLIDFPQCSIVILLFQFGLGEVLQRYGVDGDGKFGCGWSFTLTMFHLHQWTLSYNYSGEIWRTVPFGFCCRQWIGSVRSASIASRVYFPISNASRPASAPQNPFWLMLLRRESMLCSFTTDYSAKILEGNTR
jgi:hypothetical protein